MTQLTYGSMFSGIGGLDLGFDRAGWSCAFQVECDPYPVKVLQQHWPDTPRFSDVRDVTGDSLGAAGIRRVDALVGGFPCQDLSHAGRRAGLTGGERSSLFFEFVRVAQELRPRWLCIENVPGLLSSGGRRDMGVLIGTLVDSGYGIAWKSLDAQYFGLAQRRKRVFIVGHLGTPWSAPAQVLLEPESSPGDSPPSRTTGSSPADGTAPRSRGDGRAARHHRDDGVVAALRASYGGVGADDTQAHAGHLPFYDVPEVAGTLGGGAQLRGWSDDLDRSGAFPVMHGPDVAATLTGSSNPNSNLAGRSKSDDSNLVYTPTHEVSPCLQERGYKGADSDMTQAYVTVEPDAVHAFAENQRGEVRFTENNVASQLVVGGGKPGQGYPAVLDERNLRGKYSVHNGDNTCFAEDVAQCVTASKGMPGAVTDGLEVGFVRRLTTLECERLQGFPDNHTETLSDSRRYKALGNAVAVPVAEWIARRIAAVDAAT